MIDKENMSVWAHAKKTDPSATKVNTASGYKSTSINGYWMIQKATELWGPIGGKWGYEILEERFDEGAPIADRETGIILCKTVMHTIKLGLYHPSGDKMVIQYGHTPFIYSSKNGPITDTEAPKKSLMDAIKKCLSMLGFSADIFTGEFDDVNYQEELKNEEQLKRAEDKDAEEERQRAEYKKWYSDTLTTMQQAGSLNDLEGIFRTAFRKMERRGDQAGIKAFTVEKDKIKAELGRK